MTGCAERLEDRAVQDVGPDGDRGLETEDEDEDGSQERAAAHAGEADEEAGEEARERELPGHASVIHSQSGLFRLFRLSRSSCNALAKRRVRRRFPAAKTSA